MAGVDDLSSSPSKPLPDPVPGEPAWGVALLFPPQGSWTEADYLSLDAGRLIEFSDGCVEVHDMPTKGHQRIVRYLFQLLSQVVASQGLGEVFFAPLPVRLWADKFREPDLVVVRTERADYRGYPVGADLVVEVVSEGEANRRRDLETKREEYSRAGIEEYWIVDPEAGTVTVCSGAGPEYDQQIVFHRGDVATSPTLPGFDAVVNDILAAADDLGTGP